MAVEKTSDLQVNLDTLQIDLSQLPRQIDSIVIILFNLDQRLKFIDEYT
jgi:hypothetical protein